MKKNHDITILLTIYNRLEYTIKWLDFAEKQKIPFDIFISDGGNIHDIKKKLNLKKRNLNITYRKFKFFKNYKNIYQKYFFVIKYIKTKFVIVAEDDDFINIDGFIKSSNFLLNNKDYGSVKGINLLGEFILNGSNPISFVLRNENSSNNEQDLRNENSEFRLIDFFKRKNFSIFNGLHRTKNLRKVFDFLGKRDFYNLYITELIFVLILVYLGKIKRFDYIDYIKMNNTELSSSNNFSKFRPFSKITSSVKYTYENNLIFKFIKFKNKKNEFFFKNLYYEFLDNDARIRISEEKIYRSYSRKLRNIFRELLIKIKVFYILKKMYLIFFKSKMVNKNIALLNKNIINTSKKNMKFLEFILKNYN